MDKIRRLLTELVSIPSVNPEYCASDDPSGGEGPLGRFVLRWARTAGLHCSREQVAPGRFNVLCRLPGEKSGRRLILLTHMDTVGASGMSVPAFEPSIRGDRIYGRGTCDAKASLAAMLAALKNLCQKGRRPSAEVLLVATIGEEADFCGVRAFVQNAPRADGCIVGEPTGLHVVVAHKGLVRWRLHTHGRTAHASTPHKGRNAIHLMAPVLKAIERYAEELKRERHPLLGTATINVGRIRGGTAVNVVPDLCTVEIDMRLLPEMDPEAARSGLARYLRSQGVRGFTMDAPFLVDWPLEQPAGDPLVKLIQRVSRRHGAPARLMGANYGTDGSKVFRAGIPTVVFGPGDPAQAHTPDEYVHLEQVARAARIYEQVALEFC